MRVALTVESGGVAGRQLILGEGLHEIGRDHGCLVCLDPKDVQVSRHHAAVSVGRDGIRVIDQRSTNGTWVNGLRVDQSFLHEGDVIGLGAQGPRLRVRPVADDSGEPVPAPVGTRAPRPRLAQAGLYDPDRDKGRDHSPLGLLVVFGMLGSGAVLGLLLMLITGSELGLSGALAGVVAAFAPAPLYLAVWLWLDRYDPEPPWVLAGALAWGAGAATFVSGIANSLFSATVTGVTGDKAVAQILSASISAPFIEEATKGLGVLIIYLALRREFDGVIDGIAYAGVIGLGFATMENVLYYGRGARDAGAAGLAVIMFVRGVLGPFTHAVFTSMTGIGCGLARQTHSASLRIALPPLGLVAAMVLHFLWNTLAGLVGFGGFLLIYVVFWAPLFVVFFSVVIWLGRREGQLLRRMLELEVVRGLVPGEVADIVASWPRRIAWLASAVADGPRLSARRRYLRAATRLAMCYWHGSRAAAAGGQTLSLDQIPGYQREIAQLGAAI